MTAGRRMLALFAAAMLLAALVPSQRAGHALAAQQQEAMTLEDYEPAVDEAIERGLEYLAAVQTEEGWWPGEPQFATGNTGIASLCVMAFLAAGHTPGAGPYGGVINRGIDYVLSTQNEEGLFLGPSRMRGGMYSHTISTLMLSEVSGMVDPQRQERIREALPRAFEVILAAQRIEKGAQHQGGWRYNPNSRDSDLSLTGWPLMALRSARNIGAAVPVEAIDDAIAYVLRCRHESGGYAYQPGQGPGFARTGLALLCLELTGHHDSPYSREAADYLLNRLPRMGSGWFYYGIYYAAQGLYQLGEEYWEPFALHLYPMMIENQRDDGSWPPVGSGGGRAGTSYSTSLTVLALSVPAGQLPIYQR